MSEHIPALESSEGISREVAKELLEAAIRQFEYHMVSGNPMQFNYSVFSGKVIDAVERYEKLHPPSTPS